MPRYQSTALREERASVYESMKGILDAAEAESRSLTAEETQNFDRLEERFAKLDSDISRIEQFEGYAPAQRQIASNDEVEQRGPASDAEQREAFAAFLRTGEVRAALSTTAANGGYTVPQSWADALTVSLTELSPLRGLARVLTTSTGEQINFPKVNAKPTAAARAEAGTYTESEPTFSTVPLNSYDVGDLVVVSKELLRDSKFDIQAEVARLAAEAVAVKEGALLAQGADTTEHQGIVAATTGKTAASASAITADELIDLFHSVTGVYRQNGAWVMNDLTVAAIRKLKNAGNVDYVWQPGLAAGAPDTILGKPVFTDPNMPTIATGAKVIVFGDFKRGFIIRDVDGTSVQTLVEKYAEQGQVGYIVNRYSDSALIDGSALRKLVMA